MQRNNPLVSIITPNYNCSRFIAETIESVLAQTYTNWELLFQDDCSTDNTKDVVCTYSEKNPNIKYTSLEKNSGNAKKPRDYGVSISKGDYCVMLDSDDALSEDYLEKIHNKIISEQADVVISVMEMREIETKALVNILPRQDFTMPPYGQDACKYILSSWSFSGGGIAFCRELYK